MMRALTKLKTRRASRSAAVAADDAAHAASDGAQNATAARRSPTRIRSRQVAPKSRRSRGAWCLGHQPAKMGDGCIFVHPDVGVTVDYQGDVCLDGVSKIVRPDKVRTLTLTGPPEACNLIGRLQKGANGQLAASTTLGPLAPVTLPDDVRLIAGIPLAATHFAFAYPHQCVPANVAPLVSEYVGGVQREMEPVLMLALLGGFCYFDASGVLLRVNGLSFKPAKSMLFVEGPFAASAAAGAEMAKAGRMADEALTEFVEAGLVQRGWVNPEELPGGASLSEERGWPMGAFLCSDAAGGLSMYCIAATPAAATAEPQGMIAALASLSEAYTAADEASKALTESIRLFQRSGFERWLGVFGLLLPAYFLVGCLLYGRLEGWGALDSIYFLTTTATTVGYGDLTPSDDASRLLTCFYAPLGTICVMAGLTPAVSWVLARLSERMTKLANRIERVLGLAGGGGGGEGGGGGDASAGYAVRVKAVGFAAGEQQVRLSAAGQYILSALPPLSFALAGAVLAYLVHAHWSKVDAVYWTVITMTTVGYGDLLPSAWYEKAFAIAFMPLATAALAATVGNVSAIATRHEIVGTNYKLICDALLAKAAGGKPAASMSEDAFALLVLKEKGLVDDDTVDAIRSQFRAMARSGGGAAAGKEIDARVVYHHLRQQGRVLDQNAPRAADEENIARVDTQAEDRGYAEWYGGHWTRLVSGDKAAATVQRLVRGRRARSRHSCSVGGGGGAGVVVGGGAGAGGGYVRLDEEAGGGGGGYGA